jgi:hypothetical protein
MDGTIPRRALKRIQDQHVQISEKFAKQAWNEYVAQGEEIPEGKTMEDFIDILRRENILKLEGENEL